MFVIVYRIFIYSIILVSTWYVPYRLCTLFGFQPSKGLYFFSLVLVVFSIVLMVRYSRYSNPILGMMSTGAGIIFGLHLFATLSLLTIDMIRSVVSIPNNLSGWAVISTTILLTAWGIWQAQSFRVTKTEIEIEGLDKPLTLMHISDVHLGPHRGREYLEKIVTTTNSLSPDIVLINGDLIESNSALAPGVLLPLRDFKAPVFFTIGNHEHYVDIDKVTEGIKEHGVHQMQNEVIEIDGIQLVGLEYMNADREGINAHQVNDLTIKEELPKILLDKTRPAILMHHSPVGKSYVVQSGIDLMVSGHTHGGQVFPATLFDKFLFGIATGQQKIAGTTFFVSQGAGTFGPLMRLGSFNEINLIRLNGVK